MAATPARRGALQLLSPSRTPYRSFSTSRISAAFASPPKAQAANSTYNKSAAPAAQRTVVPSFPAKEPPVPTARASSAAAATSGQRSLTDGLRDAPAEIEGVAAHDWTRSYHGLGSVSFAPEQADTLLAPVNAEDVEVKPDGILYLPEIKYRRILNKAFGPGGWGLAPRGESIVTGKLVTREYGMVVQGRLVSIARGEQQYFEPDGIPTATEGCKSNALMRCCKDLGIASELWDPRFIREFNAKFTKEVWVEHVSTKKKRKIVIRKDDTVKYPFKESKVGA
ncbi:hypothetical protein E8E13_009692 [Curvularia kusanoi]|uniref:Mitochondrial genome maintenance protein MGM101 n=1 Tax=Curvularia kusanoi TaxID=90978 RepID=A0A9P4WAL3_CURKU|nr:hypothetical protein E8E13_009692 [Curvularia kusanoi]